MLELLVQKTMPALVAACACTLSGGCILASENRRHTFFLDDASPHRGMDLVGSFSVPVPIRTRDSGREGVRDVTFLDFSVDWGWGTVAVVAVGFSGLSHP